MKYEYTIHPAEAGQTLMNFCKRRLEIAHAGLQKAFRTKAIRLNGKRDDGKTLLRAGDIVGSLFPFSGSTAPRRRVPALKPYILFEDEHILVLNKPYGKAVHAGSKQEISLEEMIHQHYQELPFRPQLAHRLDKETSGVLIYGKTITMLQQLGEALQAHSLPKIYLALVHGHLEHMEGTINTPLLTLDNAQQKTVVDPKGKDARTTYTVLQEFERYTLLELSPKTGRTHQLRVHMAHIGHPIIGDPRYGDKTLDQQVALPEERLYLHCAQMTLPESFGYPPFHAPCPFANN